MAKKTKAPTPEVPAVSEQPYYLQRAHIKDFRSIRDAKVEFKPGLNIIIGANGSGKTNFVRCIENGLGKLQHDFDGQIRLSISGQIPLEVELNSKDTIKNQFRDAYDLMIEGKQEITLFQSKDSKFKSDSFQHAQLMLNRANNLSPRNSVYLRLVVVNHGIPLQYPIVDKSEDFYIGLRSVGLNIYDTSLFAQAFGSGISSVFLSGGRTKSSGLRKELPSHKELNTCLVEVQDYYLQALLPKLRLFSPIVDFRLSGSYSIYNNSVQQQVVVKDVKLEFKVGVDWLPFSALSSGTQRIFYIISEMIGSFTTMPVNGLDSVYENKKIILLEEPELGIHPDQLHKLLLFLREQSEKHQLIITTHSPQVLDMLHDDELDRITICELDEKKGTQFRKLTKKKIAAAQKFMKDVGYLSDFWLYSSLEEKSQPAS